MLKFVKFCSIMSKRGAKMVKIAICDDIISEQERIRVLLQRTKLFDSAYFYFFKDGYDLINSYNIGERYDLILLDVDKPAFNGIEAGKYISSIDANAILVFVTNYPQYAVEAFDCNAFHYLLKNASFEKFYSVITKAVERYKTLHKSILLSTKDGQFNLNIGDIYYVECCQKYLYFYTENKKYITKGTLSQAYDILAPFGFYQVHQGYIVNFEKIISIIGTDIALQNNMKVVISVRKKKEVIKAYTNYITRLI